MSDSARSDRTALLAIYRMTGGESWANQDGWLQNADDLSTWFGVAGAGDGRVLKLRSQKSGDLGNPPVGNNLLGRRGVGHEIFHACCVIPDKAIFERRRDNYRARYRIPQKGWLAPDALPT